MENYQNNTKEEIPMWRPAIRSAYDYYPFGMLMPGRYVSDTSRHCVTLTRLHWVWKWTVIGCKDYYAWVWPKLTLMGAATATPSENGILLNAQRLGEGMSFELNAQPNTENQFQLELNSLEMAKDAALQILEQNDEEEWTVLAEAPIKDGEGLTVPFYPSLGKVKVVLLGPIRVLIRRVCVEGMAWVEENQLVTICDGDGDRYRFGFNGQEKVNEWAGVGNFMDFAFRGYNPQTGRFNSPDPLHEQYPWNSDYAFAENNVIEGKDIEGKEYKSTKSAQFSIDNTSIMVPTDEYMQFQSSQPVFQYDPNKQSQLKQGGFQATKEYIVGKQNFENTMEYVIPVGSIGMKVLKGEEITGGDIVWEAAGFLPFGKIASKSLKVASYGFKHIANSKIPWKKIVETTKTGPAKFRHGTDIEKMTKQAWDEGQSVTNGKK